MRVAEGSSISFAACGFHYSWYFGVALHLQQNYDLTCVRFLGSSAGSAVAALLAMDVSIEEVLSDWYEEVFAILERIPYAGKVSAHNAVLHSVFSRRLDAWDRRAYTRATGRLFISVFSLEHAGRLVSTFTSNADILDTVLASCHVPCVTHSGLLYQSGRHGKCIDGVLQAPSPSLSSDTLRLWPYRWSPWRCWVYPLTMLLPLDRRQMRKYVDLGLHESRLHDDQFHRHGVPKRSRL